MTLEIYLEDSPYNPRKNEFYIPAICVRDL
jgi:hypothetical protein